MRDFGENRSETGRSETSYSPSENLVAENPWKARFIQGKYTTEDAIEFLNKLGFGAALDNATKLVKSVESTINSINFADLQTLTTDEQKGQAVLEILTDAIGLLGDAGGAVVCTNFNLQEYCVQLKTERLAQQESLRHLLATKMHTQEPKESFRNLCVNRDIRQLEAQLTEQFYDAYQLRMDSLNQHTEHARVAPTEEEHSELSGNSTVSLPQPTYMAGYTFMTQAPAGTRTSPSTRFRASQSVHSDESDYEEPWEASPEYTQYQQELAYRKNQILDKYDNEFIDAMQQHMVAVAHNNKIIEQASIKEEDLKRCQAVEVLVIGMHTQLTMIMQKVKGAVQMYPFLRKALEGNVIVNGLTIIDPYEHNNVSGVYHHLRQKYGRANMSYFCTHLLRILSEEASITTTQTKLKSILDGMDSDMRTWYNAGLDKMLTQDFLFTVALLKRIHPESKERQDCVETVMAFAKRLEADPSLGYGAMKYPGHPVYSHLAEKIEAMEKAREWATARKAKDSKPSTRNTYHSGTQLEQAAVAAVGPDGAYKGRRERPKPGITTTVSRDANLWVGDKKQYAYTATREPCSACTHIPRCHNKEKCDKCGLYGHPKWHCCQSPQSGGGGGQSP